jgi:hypothetical protein
VVEQRKNSVHDTKLNEINRKLNVFLKHLQMKRSTHTRRMATLLFTLGRDATHSMEQNPKLEE